MIRATDPLSRLTSATQSEIQRCELRGDFETRVALFPQQQKVTALLTFRDRVCSALTIEVQC